MKTSRGPNSLGQVEQLVGLFNSNMRRKIRSYEELMEEEMKFMPYSKTMSLKNRISWDLK